MSVGEVVASALSELGSGVPATLPDEGHRQILAALEPAWGQDLSERDKLHDRGRARAETYVVNRGLSTASGLDRWRHGRATVGQVPAL